MEACPAPARPAGRAGPSGTAIVTFGEASTAHVLHTSGSTGRLAGDHYGVLKQHGVLGRAAAVRAVARMGPGGALTAFDRTHSRMAQDP